MIKSFRHKGLELFFHAGSRKGVSPAHAARLRLQLGRLDGARCPQDMDLPGWRLHQLHGTLRDHWAVRVDGNWRLTFAFDGTDAILVNYQDYH